jgi:hypothetical protein
MREARLAIRPEELAQRAPFEAQRLANEALSLLDLVVQRLGLDADEAGGEVSQ